MKNMVVRPVHKSRVLPLIYNNHYARREPQIQYSFGLIKENELCGACTFGQPASTGFNKLPYKVIELNRLVLLNNEKNVCSFFISSCLRLLDKPTIVVSFADENMNHYGYVYQATNWLYTGLGGDQYKYYLDGKETHSKTISNRYKTSSLKILSSLGHTITKQKIKQKHRYFYFVARSKSERKTMISLIGDKFGYEEYPKGKNINYDM